MSQIYNLDANDNKYNDDNNNNNNYINNNSETSYKVHASIGSMRPNFIQQRNTRVPSYLGQILS